MIAASRTFSAADVRAILARTGWSQMELARRAGVNSSIVCRVVKHGREPGRILCAGIERALAEAPADGVAVPDLLNLANHVQAEASAVGIEGSPTQAVTAMRLAIERLRAILEGR